MNILHKFKETAISVLPVMAIVFLLGFTIVPLEPSLLLKFFISGILLIVGLTIFLLGVDLGIQPMGERSGAELTKRKDLSFLLVIAFVIGFIVTIAEPDIQVFADQVRGVFPSVGKVTFTFIIAGGVGLFIMLGLLRTVTNLSLKWTLFISYTILFVLIFFAQDSFTAIAFDSGGATTGPMTVPFIMALGLGVSSVRAGKQDNSFGLTGISSIGPVLAVVIYAIAAGGGGGPSTSSGTPVAGLGTPVAGLGVPEPVEGQQITVFASALYESFTSIAPLFVMFIVFQFLLLKMTARQVFRMLIGFVYSFVGLAVFLGGVYGGFMQTGKLLGEAFGTLAFQRGGIWTFLLILTGLLLGAIIVCAEPAVWCLSEQVETVSGGTIKRKMLLVFLSVGTAVAIGLAMWRAIAGFNIKWLLIPGYAISMLLMLFCPELFTGIAFDSGGVASGPLTSTFVLSFALGAAQSSSGSNDSFGVIALVAMMPLIAIQIMGIVYKIKTSKNKQGGQSV
ncbi:MAG: DUF1538 domain-containing protein [Treponema sp.]|nr:DUF1538 domain-containing protein [Treponema sp.]MBR5032214.1 DUF1538 domain-containing protein [Treponema sp.]